MKEAAASCKTAGKSDLSSDRGLKMANVEKSLTLNNYFPSLYSIGWTKESETIKICLNKVHASFPQVFKSNNTKSKV